MTVLITGGSGTLGKELKNKFPKNLSPTHDELDITDKQLVLIFSRKII